MKPSPNHYLLGIGRRDPSRVAVAYKAQGQWIRLNWVEYEKQIHLLASCLLHHGLRRGDRIAIMSNTRYEWSLCDWACLGLGLVVVPIYSNSSQDDISYIIEDSKSCFIFCESDLQKKMLLEMTGLPNEKIISFQSDFAPFLLTGEKGLIPNRKTFQESCESTSPEVLATLVYTSGTTGQPKGVMITHRQILSEVTEAFQYVGVVESDRSLSLLPYSHILGRVEQWGNLIIGFEMYFAESIERVRSNLIEVRPTIMVAVPRIFEKIYVALLSQLEASPAKSKIFSLALDVGKKVSQHKQKRSPLPPLLFAKYKIAKRLVLNKINLAFGGRLRFAVSGGAPLSKEICEFFHACDLLLLEGYGLTETTAAVCVNAPHDYAFGTVGKPLPDVQIKFAEDGEILIKSAKVMTGYYNQSEETAQVLEQGYLHSGDIGQRLPSGHIQITDRKKDLIKTANGKYVAPQKLEILLSLHPFVSHALIHGDQRKYVVALISPHLLELKKFAEQRGLSLDIRTLLQEKSIQDVFKNHLAQVNSQLASHEAIKRFQVLENEFTIESGELTPSLKIKRRLCEKKYKNELDRLYN
jgi:long-chain acyl-CoA synthetase